MQLRLLGVQTQKDLKSGTCLWELNSQGITKP